MRIGKWKEIDLRFVGRFTKKLNKEVVSHSEQDTVTYKPPSITV